MPEAIHRVLAVRRLTPHTYAVRFTREGLAFRAGQHVSVALVADGPAGPERDYSIYSGERDADLAILVREVEGGALSPRLAGCRPGDALRVAGPLGGFVLDPARPPGEPLLFVATGTGCAPFHAMFRTDPDLAARLVHGVRLAAEAYDRADYPPDRHVLCVSRGAPGDAFAGRVTDWLRAHPVAPQSRVYLCGSADMIYDVMTLLEAQGVPHEHVFSEIYF